MNEGSALALSSAIDFALAHANASHVKTGAMDGTADAAKVHANASQRRPKRREWQNLFRVGFKGEKKYKPLLDFSKRSGKRSTVRGAQLMNGYLSSRFGLHHYAPADNGASRRPWRQPIFDFHRA